MTRLLALAGLAALATPLAASAQDAFPQLQTTPRGPDLQQQQDYGQPGFARSPEATAAAERRDFGVPPTPQLHQGAMHGPTPASIPGGQVITTPGLVELLARRDVPTLVFDVLGGPHSLPGAIPAVPAHQPGTFDDPLQQELGRYLAEVTGGNRETPLVFYCLNPECWMSYNASLRAINLGYANVLWYRGGIEAWQEHGQPTVPAGIVQR